MRSLFFGFVGALVLSSYAQAAGFFSVHSPNGVDVWAVGEAGSVYHSLDGGQTWTSVTLGSGTLHGVFTMSNRVWIVGDNGVTFFSSNSGSGWQSGTLPGSATMHAVHFEDLTHGWAVGENGTIVQTIDGGVTWSQLSSSTTEPLYSITFTDALTAFAAGASGTLVKSSDGGATWSLVSPSGWTKDLYAIGGKGLTVYAAGSDAFCQKSWDGGQTWGKVDLYTDTKSDVNDIFVLSADSVFFMGGGGYIRRSFDGGGTFEYGIHPLQATMSRIFFYDSQHGWACANHNNVVIRTTDGGATWSLPTGTVVTRGWDQRLNTTSSIGNTLVVNPWNKNLIYVALGRFIYMSGDRGDTWTQTATISGSSGSTHSFYISPHDTNTWVVAYTGGGDQIRRTTDRGLTWTQVLVRNFTSYGMPLEMDPDHPDTLIFAADGSGGSGADGVVYRSMDFGATWDTLAQTMLRSPCDIVILPDSSYIVYIADGVTGSGSGKMWRSSSGGKEWTQIYSVSGSEIPTISVSRLRISTGFATAWGSGGVMRTQNEGVTWSQVATTGSTWGTDISKDDPNVLVYGSYGTGDAYISTDGGDTFLETSVSGSNYAYLAYDRSLFFAQQSGGVFKYTATYVVPTTNEQAVVLLDPNGGETWIQGDVEQIQWTSSNVGNVKIEYRVSDTTGWTVIAPSVPAGDGSYGWFVPNTPTNEARVRISDVTDGSPIDSSDAVFSIASVTAIVTPDSLSFGSVRVGEMTMDTVRITNNGTATLVVSSVTTGSGVFNPGRTSFTIGPGQSDTLSVWFEPDAIQSYRDTMVIATNAAAGDIDVVLTGIGESALSVKGPQDLPREYVLEQNYPNPFNPQTEIRYGVPQGGKVRLKVFSMLGQEVATLVDEFQDAGWYKVTFGGKVGGRELASGLYLYRLEALNFVSTKKMLFLK